MRMFNSIMSRKIIFKIMGKKYIRQIINTQSLLKEKKCWQVILVLSWRTTAKDITLFRMSFTSLKIPFGKPKVFKNTPGQDDFGVCLTLKNCYSYSSRRPF